MLSTDYLWRDQMKKYLEIAKIVAVQGIKGEVRAQYWCDDPELLCEFDTLYYDANGKAPAEIEYARPHKNVVVMKIKGIDTPEQAQTLRNKILFMDRDETVLPEGCYFIQDLIGLDVVDADNGRNYGKITDVSSYGASDIYTVRKNGKDFLFPAAPEFIEKTDIEGGKLLIRPIAGIFDDDTEDVKENED